jgi:hypothetical protein
MIDLATDIELSRRYGVVLQEISEGRPGGTGLKQS